MGEITAFGFLSWTSAVHCTVVWGWDVPWPDVRSDGQMYGPHLLQQPVKFGSSLCWRELALEGTGRCCVSGPCRRAAEAASRRLPSYLLAGVTVKSHCFLSPGRHESAVWGTSFPQPGALPAELHCGHPGGHGSLDEVSSDRNWDDHHQIWQVRGAGQLPTPHPPLSCYQNLWVFIFWMVALKLVFLANYAHLPASGRRITVSGCPRSPNCEVQKVTVGPMCWENSYLST